MARIPMTNGFTPIPEGTHVFRVYDATYDETFGKIEIKLVNAKGMTMIERYNLKKNDDSWNEGALNAFSFMCKVVMNDFTLEEVEPEELIGHYVKAEVVHNTQPNKNDPTKTVTFANLGHKEVSDGFEEEPTEKALTLGNEKADSVDLDDLLG